MSYGEKVGARVEGLENAMWMSGESPRRTHQFRALSRRTLTIHKRNWKLDLCCLGLCPAYPSHIAVPLMI